MPDPRALATLQERCFVSELRELGTDVADWGGGGVMVSTLPGSWCNASIAPWS